MKPEVKMHEECYADMAGGDCDCSVCKKLGDDEMITENVNNVRDGFIRSEPAKSRTEAPLMQPFPAATVKQKETYDESLSWHNGYRAACKEICERFGLDNTDEIELLVKERDALKAKNDELHDVLDELKLIASLMKPITIGGKVPR